MFINVKEIRSGDRLQFSVASDKIGIDELEEMVVCRFILTKSKKRIRVKGTISFRYNIICARCLDTVRRDFEEKIDCMFERGTPYITKGEVIELAYENMDIYYYEKDELNLSPLIKDTIFLSIPIKPLCRPHCKGLCPHCGKNLNQGDCECQK
ncbi:DUF177 domain-containing protein [candidate division WOR-3 bacterium]|nr:DUF177 domain-containing protein [candidate division WOR-3 bacterium]